MRVALVIAGSLLVAACGRGRAGEHSLAGEDAGAHASSGLDASTAEDAAVVDASVDASEDASVDASDDRRTGRDARVMPDAAQADLLSLALSPLTLTPAFSPGIHDYSVQCVAGTNALTVRMTAASGGTVALVAPTPTGPAASATVDLQVAEGQAIVVNAAVGSTSTEYWIRCLPHDFPRIGWDAHTDAGVPPPGYYLIGTAQPASALSGYAVVLDSQGVPVWYSSGRGDGIGVGDVDDVVSGAISFFSGPGRAAEIVQLSPFLQTTAAPAATVFDPHELQVLPNGDFIALSNPVESGVDLTGLSIQESNGRVDHPGRDSQLAACNLVEFEPTTGQVVWTWVGDDHLDPVEDSTAPDFLGDAVDAYHCNSIDVDPANGNLLVSSRNMDSVFYVERPSGVILWKLGGSTFTKDGAPYIPVADPFYRQHDARLQPGWSTCGGGQISVFDDESDEPGPARAVLYDVVLGLGGDGGAPAGCDAVPGQTPGATVAWQLGGEATSSSRGSFRILADGSHVIGWGLSLDVNGSILTEVDVAGNDLLDVYFVEGDSTYRAIKAPLGAFDLGVLRATAGMD